jgi:hypothetical protein
MRILQITDWNPSPGGSEAYVAWLLEALPRAGHDVRLLTSNAGSAADGNADFVAPASRHPAARSTHPSPPPSPTWFPRHARVVP